MSGAPPRHRGITADAGRTTTRLLLLLLLAGLALAHWQVRVMGTATSPRPSMYSLDVYTQHVPMTGYAFAALRRGELPLWNPYQLCGVPFLPIPYTGVFYPPNALYLLLDTAVATDILGCLHGMLALAGMWLLVRHLGAGSLAALAAAATFAWSGWLLYNVNQPSLWAGMAWMPLTVLAADLVLLGRRFAWLLLVAVLALQLLGGAVEVLVHALLAAAFVVVPRLVELVSSAGIGRAMARLGVLAACGVAALLVAAVQILPTVELLAQSSRAPGSLPFGIARLGHIDAADFVPGLWGEGVHVKVAAGLLPLLLAAVALGDRRAWPFVACAGLGALLAGGGELYRLWHTVPFAGSAFQRPSKFLDLWAFGLAATCGLGLERLSALAATPRLRLWRRPAWLAAVAATAALLAVAPPVAWKGAPLLVLAAVLLPVYGLVEGRRARQGVVAALAVAQITGLFLLTGNRDLRPSQQPHFYDGYPDLRRFLASLPQPERAYVFPSPQVPRDLIMKAGMMHGFNLMADYEAMISRRYADCFDQVTDFSRGFTPAGFQGNFVLGPRARMKLMDLTGTRTYVAFRGQPGDSWLWQQSQGADAPFRLLLETPVFRAYERPAALPRAYLVPRARVLPKPRWVLQALAAEEFNPRRELILEELPEQGRGRGVVAPGTAAIVAYEPALVRVTVDTRAPAFLVLSDLYYPGWKAYLGDTELPILRANHLFRAVQVPAGAGEVRFEYRPASVRLGLAISAAALLALATAAALEKWRGL